MDQKTSASNELCDDSQQSLKVRKELSDLLHMIAELENGIMLLDQRIKSTPWSEAGARISAQCCIFYILWHVFMLKMKIKRINRKLKRHGVEPVTEPIE